jgi:hypothetical protein
MRLDSVAISSPPLIPGAIRSGSAGEPSPRAQLSADELAYFAELERMGPLVYGRQRDRAGSAPPPVLGQRVDVKA